MDTVSIGILRHADLVRQRLEQGLTALESQGIRVALSESTRGHLTFLNCTLANEHTSPVSRPREIFRRWLSGQMADHLTGECETDYLLRILRRHYGHFEEVDKERILNQARDMVAALEARGKVPDQVSDFLASCHEFVVDGFLRFRLKDYYAELEASVDRAVDDFVADREHQEFVRLLKYFVEVQEPRFSLLHVLEAPEPRLPFVILDENGDQVEVDVPDDALPTPVDSDATDIDLEDLLLSNLINLAPRHVVLHISRDREVVKTIQGVFEARTSFCKGCERCRRYSLTSPEERGSYRP